ncbi:MAG TPA: histidine kinase dimerization/phosphoacceptor domain-containing protein, partial [Acidimicrobiia bacterium]|nr:histidine kinase dimerization/phosphoacceptor domain-containing protein [Acidimicrobiia bacterium]
MSPTGDLLAGSHVHGDFEWPWPAWVARAAAVLPVATAFVAVWQRDAFWPVESGTVFAAVAVLPWLVEAVTLRHLPRWLFTGVVLAGVLGLVADPVEIDMSAFLLVFLAAEIACTASLRTGIAVALAAEAVLLYVEVFGIYDDSFPWVMGIAFGWAGGAAVGLQFRLLQESKASAAASAERAAVEERQRIAREVHDVVAHSLSAVMLHLTGVRRELETGGDPAEAASALREAEEVGREALADIRRTVGLLGP